MKIVCKETFERGMSRQQGGMFKLTAGTEYSATSTDHGVQFTPWGGRVRTVPREVLDDLVKQGLIEIKT